MSLKNLVLVSILFVFQNSFAVDCMVNGNIDPECAANNPVAPADPSANGSWDNVPQAPAGTSGVSDFRKGEIDKYEPGSADTKAAQEASGPTNHSGTNEIEGPESCEEAHTEAAVACKGSQVNNAVSQRLANFQAARHSGDIAAACKQAQNISELGFSANLGFSITCQAQVQDCLKSCGEGGDFTGLKSATVRSYLKECNGFNNNWQQALVQGMGQVEQYIRSGDCLKLAGGECTGQTAFSNPQCPQQYCSVGNRLITDPNCNTLAKQCSDATTARTNPACTCVTNPTAPGCAANPGAIANSGATNKGIDVKSILDGLIGGTDGDDYAGRDSNGTKSQAESQQAGGAAGLSAGGTGGGGGGGSGGDGSPPNGVNTNILGKPSGGGGGYPFAGGSGGGGGAYPFAANRGGGDGNNKTFNLRDFLPGGKKDARAIASQTLAQQGITPSMGLSNFQKVTRKISEKRATLEP